MFKTTVNDMLFVFGAIFSLEDFKKIRVGYFRGYMYISINILTHSIP